MLIGELISKRREILGLSLEDVSRRMALAGYDTNKTNLWQWETNYQNRQAPMGNKEFRYALASALEVDINEMMRLLGYVSFDEDRTPEARQVADIVDHLPIEDRERIVAMVKAYTGEADPHQSTEARGEIGKSRSKARKKNMDIQTYSMKEAMSQLEVILARRSDEQIEEMLLMAYKLVDMIARSNPFTISTEKYWDFFAWFAPLDIVRQKLDEERSKRGIEIPGDDDD